MTPRPACSTGVVRAALRGFAVAVMLVAVVPGCGGEGDEAKRKDGRVDERARDSAQLEVADTISIPKLRRTRGYEAGVLAFGEGAVWLSRAPDAVLRIDPETRRVAATIPLRSPGRIVVGEGSVWVIHGDNGLARIDPSTNQVTEIRVGEKPVDVAVSGGSAWVTHRVEGGPVVRVDTATNKVVATVTPGVRGTWGIAADDEAVWVTAPNALSVLRLDPETNEVAATIETVTADVTATPERVAIGADSVWISDSTTPSVLRVDPEGNDIVDQIRSPTEQWAPDLLAVDDGSVWAVAGVDVFHVDAGSRAVIGTARLVESPGADPETITGIALVDGSVWVANPDEDEIAIVEAEG